MATRTPRSLLLGQLIRLFRIAHASRRKGAPPARELLDMGRGMSRRDFLRASAVGAGALATTRIPFRYRNQDMLPRIAVVGAGVAGLNTAYQLQKLGIPAAVYEASTRIGGRMFTAQNVMGDGLYTELGGEFINTDHADMLALIDELGLDVIDTYLPELEGLSQVDYFYEGRQVSYGELIEAYSPFADRIGTDVFNLDENYDEVYADYDALSITEYLDELGMTGLIRTVIESAFTYENGSPASSQSLLNFLYLHPVVDGDFFEVIGGSDERYKVLGGNQQIPLGLAGALDTDVELGYRLEAIRQTASGYRLAFETDGGALEIDADVVVLAIPLTVLRQVEMNVDVPDEVLSAVRTLGYGTSSKVMAGLNRRPWLGYNSIGYSITDLPFAGSWDNALGQSDGAAGVTFFAGGMEALAFGDGTPQEAAERLLPHLERLYPGALAAYNGRSARMHWATHPYTLAGYSSPQPGQGDYTYLLSAVYDGLLFAGEHTSPDHWGYMNGAAESGRRSAESIVELIGAMG